MAPSKPISTVPLDRDEISDLIHQADASGTRKGVRRADIVARLAGQGNRRAARLVRRMPVSDDGILDPGAVDGTLVRAHCELQRLNEEFRQGERMLSLLRPMVDALRRSGVAGPYRVVDVGCGLGFVIRWLAAHGDLGHDVELIGCDYNAPFVRLATRLAAEEELSCAFLVADAFSLDTPAAIFVSTGVLHHFRGAALVETFRRQSQACMIAHFDIQPSWLAPIGAWIFHRARMREPLARHDGVLSARRAHADGTLLAAAREGLPEFTVGLYDVSRSRIPILKVLRPVVATGPGLADPFLASLGRRAARLVDFQ